MGNLDIDVGWATDLAVQQLAGSSVEDRGDHLVVRTPAHPTFHWGNCVLVLDPTAADDAVRWIRVFREAFPSADWVAVGLRRMPADPAAWAGHGVALDRLEVLAAAEVPRQAPLADGYEVRLLADEDWEQTVKLAVDDNAASGSFDPVSYEAFSRARAQRTRELCERQDEIAAFFGAFSDGVLAAQLGIVRCGGVARYQSVLTSEPHRRRGLASHLVGVAARWAGHRGCDRWVIVTETTNPALRVYRSVGFEPVGSNVQAYRRL